MLSPNNRQDQNSGKAPDVSPEEIRARFPTLDDVVRDNRLAALLGVPLEKRPLPRFLAKALVENGLMSPVIPEGHSLTSHRHKVTFYIDSEVVGEEQAEKNRAVLLEQEFSNVDLDSISIRKRAVNSRLLLLHDREPSVQTVVRRVLELTSVSPEIPEGYWNTETRGHTTRYVDPDIVGADIAKRNVLTICRGYLKSRGIKSIADVEQHYGLAGILGIPKSDAHSGAALAAKFVELKLLSPILPQGEEQKTRWSQSRFLDAKIVGEELAESNLKEMLKRRLNLEGVRYLHEKELDIGMAAALGIPKAKQQQPVAIRARLATLGILSPLVPESLLDTEHSRLWGTYLDPAVVGEGPAAANRDRLVQRQMEGIETENLDEVPSNPILARLMGLKGNDCFNRRKLVSNLLRQRWLSPVVPEGFVPPNGTFYFAKELLGEKAALANAKRYLQANILTPEQITRRMPGYLPIARLLGVSNLLADVRDEIQRREWLPSSFRSFANSTLPAEFRTPALPPSKRSTLARNVEAKEIGSYSEISADLSAMFQKGEFFEQLVGCLLLRGSRDEVLIPQYCLVVEAPYFGCRADFRLGQRIIEVKWGNSDSNIVETREKHQKHLQAKHDLSYEIVTAVPNPRLPFPTMCFDSYCDAIPNGAVYLSVLSKIQSNFDTVTPYLADLRDVLYTLVDQANGFKGAERHALLDRKISELDTALESPETLPEWLESQNVHHFASLEAFFHHGDQLYRGKITPSAMSHEQPERRKTVSFFGNARFYDPLDRDIAVMLELSDELHGENVETILPPQKRPFQNLVFALPDGRKISSQTGEGVCRISDLAQLPSILKFQEGNFEFGLRYLSVMGARC